MLFWIPLVFGGLALLLTLGILLVWRPTIDNSAENKLEQFPRVSILVPARNEEQNLPSCLASLLAQEYPQGLLEILVADDHSEDATMEVIQAFAGRDQRVRGIVVGKQLGKARGKANALAYLANAASGEVLVFTDADMYLPPKWVVSMVTEMDLQNLHLVAGHTIVQRSRGFLTFQRADWILGWGLIHLAEELGTKVTAAGNNMIVQRSAYQAVGGFESLEFSVTEDFALYHALCQGGFRAAHAKNSGCKAYTKPLLSFQELAQQRKRWLEGAKRLPFWLVGLLSLQVLYYPCMILSFLWQPWWASGIFLFKVVFQSFFIRKVAASMSSRVSLFELVSYELNSFWWTPYLLVRVLWPSRIAWKGRKY